jgi:endonuclease-3
MVKRSELILKILSNTYPNAHCELDYSSAWQLLVATILSAQCTDKRVNLVTKKLFSLKPDINDYINFDISELKELIHSTGFFNNKAKHILGAAKKILTDYKGIVPNSMEELLTVPGIARKSANVILSVWYKTNEGVVVDTHVIRLTHLLGITEETNVLKIEKALMILYKKKDWERISTLLVWHGRNICIARRPKCSICPLNKICPSAKLDNI